MCCVVSAAPNERIGPQIVRHAPYEIRSRFICFSSSFLCWPVCVIGVPALSRRGVLSNGPRLCRNDFADVSFAADVHRFSDGVRARSAVMSREYYNLRFVVTTPTLSVTEYNCLKEPCNQVR